MDSSIFERKPPEYGKACMFLEEMGMYKDSEEPETQYIKGNVKFVLGETVRTFLGKSVKKENDYDSFLNDCEKYIKIHERLSDYGFVKERSIMGVDVYRSGKNKILLGNGMKFSLEVKMKVTLKQGLIILDSLRLSSPSPGE